MHSSLGAAAAVTTAAAAAASGAVQQLLALLLFVQRVSPLVSHYATLLLPVHVSV
jgi:hypothetical protein